MNLLMVFSKYNNTYCTHFIIVPNNCNTRIDKFIWPRVYQCVYPYLYPYLCAIMFQSNYLQKIIYTYNYNHKHSHMNTSNIEMFNEYETMMKIYTEKCSICRYGDGEIYHMFQYKSKYKSGGQKCSSTFQQKLIDVLKNTNEKILIGFSGYYCDDDFIKDNYVPNSLSNATKNFISETKPKLYAKFPSLFAAKLYSAEITRLAQLKNNKPIIEIFNKMFSENDCVFVGNIKVINIIRYTMYEIFKSIEFIETPCSNAYDDYDKICDSIIQTDLSKNKLLLISLGPTATIMSYDLSLKGHWVIDIGHYFEIYAKIK